MNPTDTRAILDRHLGPVLERGIDPASFGPDARLREDMGLTSLESVSLLMALEEEFDVEISDEEIGGLKTLGDLVTLLSAKLETIRPA
jgi:acyl carrier protein